MNDPGKQPEKQFRRRLILICAGATPILVLSSLCSVRGRPVLGLILALLCTAGGALLFFLAAKARDRKLSAGMKPLSEIRSELSAPAETERAVPELIVQQIGGLNDKRYYRVIEGPEQYHFILIPSPQPFLQPTQEAFAQRVSAQGTDEEIRARYRRGFAVNKREILQLELRPGLFPYRGVVMLSCASIRLRTAKRKREFLLLEQPQGRRADDADRFFSAVCDRIRVDTSCDTEKNRRLRRKALDNADAILAETADTQDPKTARVFRRIVPVLDLVSILIFLVCMFAGLSKPHYSSVLTWVMLAIVLLPWVMLMFALRYMSILGLQAPEQSLLEQHGVTLVCPLFGLFVPVGALSLMLVSSLEAHPLAAYLWGAGLTALAVILVYLRTPQARRFLALFIAVWVLCAMFSPGPALAVDRMFDWHAPETEQVQLLARIGDELTIRDETGALRTIDLDKVENSVPDGWGYGQKAELTHHSGALGIGWEELRSD